MEWRVVGVLGRGFAPAQPPRIRVSVVRVGKDASRDVGFGGSKPRENFDAIDPVREPVGDIRWRLETHVPWCETPDATLAASPGAGDNARTQSARQEIRIRVAGAGSVRIDMKAGSEDQAQRWYEVGDPSQGLQVRLVMKQQAGQQAERERLARRERIQRRQLELAMMRQLRPEKLLAWEERRAQRAARIIQRSWKSSCRHTKPRTETHVTRKRADDLALDDLIAEGDEYDDDEEEEDNDGEEDEDEDEVENDDNIGAGENNATKGDGRDPAEEDATGKNGRAKQAIKRRSKQDGTDGSTYVSTTDEDSRRLHQLFDDLSREAHDRMVNGGRFSTHEKFQALMEGYRELQTQWASFQIQDEEMREHEESRERLLRRSDKLCLRLESLQVPLASYPDPSVSENQETALLAASDEIGAAHPRDAEETQSPAAAQPRWPLSRDRVVLEAARNAHATALENAQVGKEWWRVQVGHEERDIRTVKMGKAPWRVDTSSLSSAKAHDGEDEDADAQASKWWVAYASKSAAQAEALAIKASNRVAQLDVFEDNVKRDTEPLG
ncbi:Hypothetical Protein FCC1311_057202 [Hondaea fermentalgiana]|uniref:Uncharacterized protein n=1 Tax=Hondaea fermentalgiana TaxID=2315210 RepID=A0A2R5GGN5_9STRA|nr:Hypothetical Protein FCC1311_057202 [Hondaea fermentalgiana]|eukprot:GBG29499.1 Hypothetical Protein FCC1311_057202 [Hondaea fermentalgiana]